MGRLLIKNRSILLELMLSTNYKFAATNFPEYLIHYNYIPTLQNMEMWYLIN